ncbi:PQQ-binding-like beta-propeller repeat protein [Halobaculum sp. EA56]|uniref:outer membrane protein assembly factor BamB family protein n=1 Tax=Halobaculum sp. EA56 TaxID=3421648 RepID=UPI003EBCA9EA
MPSDRHQTAPTSRRRYLALAGAAATATATLTAGCTGVARRLRAPSVDWRTRLDAGYVAGPLAVADGRVVAMAERTPLALDAGSGERLWSDEEAFDRAFAGPVVVDGVAVVGDDRRAGYRLDGERAWTRDDGRFRPHAAVGGLVVGASDREKAGIAAVDPADGALVWGAAPGDWANDGADAAHDAVAAGPGVVATSFESRLAGVDADGAVRWTRGPEWDTHGPGRPSLATDGSTVVAASGAVVGVDPTTGARRWRTVLPDFAADVALADGTAYVGVEGDTPKVDSWGEPGGVVAFDVGTGTERWRTALAAPARTVGAGAGRVVAGTASGDLVGLDAEGGALRWRRSVGDDVFTPPLLASDGVYVAAGRNRASAVLRLDR